MDELDDARNRFTALASRQDYRMARLQLDLEHLSQEGSDTRHSPQELVADVLSLRRSERDRIDSLLGRMDGGAYGRCEKCRGDVSAERLRRLPYARYCAACVFGDDPDFRSHIDHQQRSLERLVEALTDLSRNLIERSVGEDVSLAGSDAVAELLSDLSEELGEHFALEETDGYLTELTRVAPDLEQRVDAVQEQHAGLCRDANRLVDLARDAGTSRFRWCAIEQALAELSVHLRQHELEELEMTESTFSPQRDG